MSHTSSMEKEHTVAPRFGAISTSPSASSIVRACLTGVLLTPSRSASCSSIKRSPDRTHPSRSKPASAPKSRWAASLAQGHAQHIPLKPPFPNHGEPLVYNLRRTRILRQEFQSQGWGSGELCGLTYEQVPGREDLASVRPHCYGVLVLGGELIVCGHHRPAVF